MTYPDYTASKWQNGDSHLVHSTFCRTAAAQMMPTSSINELGNFETHICWLMTTAEVINPKECWLVGRGIVCIDPSLCFR